MVWTGFEPGTFSTKADEQPAQLGSPTDAVQIIIIFKYMNTTFDINVRLDALGHCAPLLANLLGQ